MLAQLMPLLAAEPNQPLSYYIGFYTGVMLPIVAAAVGAGKCIAIAGRPRTSTNAMLSLALILIAMLIAALGGISAEFLKQRGTPSFVAALAGMIAIGMVLAGFVLAIIALVQIYSRPGRYDQGSRQSWASLIIGVLALGLIGVGVVKAFNQPRTVAQKVPPWLQTTQQPAAEEKIAFDEFKFAFDAPPRPWVRMDSKKLSPDSCLGFGRTMPAVYFVIIAENIGADLDLNADSLAEVAVANMNSAAASATVHERVPHTVNGIDGIRIYTTARIGPSDFAYAQFVCVRNGRAYQLMTWGLAADQSAVRSAAETLNARFHLTEEPSAESSIATAPLPPHESPFGYRVHLGPAWRTWKSMASESPDADYGALRGNDAGMIVLPVLLMDRNPPIRALADALLARFDMKLPRGEVKTTRDNTAEVLTCTVNRTIGEDEFFYRIKCLKGQRSGALAMAWTTQKSNEAGLDEALAAVTLDAPSTGFDARQLTADQTSVHSLVFNSLGMSFYERNQFADAAPYFQIAAELNPAEPVILENLILAYIDSRQFPEAASCAIRGATQFPDRKSFRAKAALCWGELGKIDNATQQYEQLFADGYDDENVLREYAMLLSKHDRLDQAIAAVAAFRQRSDTIQTLLMHTDLLLRKGEAAQAIEMVKERQAQIGFNGELAHAQADYCLFAERYDEALQLTKQLRERGHEDPPIILTQGRAEFGLKLYREAKASFELVLVKDPAQARAREMLDLVSGMLGEGENTSLKTPIEPVAIPDALLRPTPVKVDETSSAIYLNRITAISFLRDREFKTSEYRHVKVLDSHGVESFSTMQFSFDPLSEQVYVNKVEVSDADGKVVATGKVSDYYVLDENEREIASQSKILHIPISGLRPGYTLEVLMTRMDVAPGPQMRWTQHVFSPPVPAQQAALLLRGDLGDVMHRASSGVAPPQTIDGAMAWIVSAPPAYRYEPMQTHISRYLPQVVLGAKSATWEAEAKDYLTKIEPRLQPHAEITQLAARLTSSAKTEAEKIAAIARHVQQDYIYKAIEFGRRARMPQPVTDTLHNRFGDCKDHALLVQQLLTAAGVPAHLALVRTTDQVVTDAPSLDQFNHMIVFVPPTQEDSRPRFYDCTDKGSDLRAGHAYLWTNKALVLDPSQPRLVDLPAAASMPNSVVCTRDVRVMEQGDVSVREIVRASGYDASSLRAALKQIEPTQRAQSIERMLAGHASDLVVEKTSIEQLEQTDQSLVVEVNYTMKRRFNPLREQLIGGLPAPWARYYLTPDRIEKRQTPFEIRLPIDFVCNTTVHLPPGYTLATAPAPRTFADAFADGKISYTQEGAAVKIDLSLRLKPGEHPASAYSIYQQSSAEVISALEQNVVLEKTPR